MDKLTFILDPLKEVFSIIMGYVPTVLGVLLTLVVGTLVAREVGKIVGAILKSIHIDKVSHTIGLAHILTTGGIKRSLSDLIGFVVTLGITLTTLIIALNFAGVTLIGTVTDPIMAYIPGVVSGVLTLMLGMFVAHIVSKFVRLVAANTDMPKPELLASFTKWAVVLMAFSTFIEKVGLGYLLSGTPLIILISSIGLALGLAFGLGGRDYATHYLGKLLKK